MDLEKMVAVNFNICRLGMITLWIAVDFLNIATIVLVLVLNMAIGANCTGTIMTIVL